MLRALALPLLIAIFAVASSPGTAPRPYGSLLAQVATPTPGPIYWYYDSSATPSPYPSAWAAINGAFAAGNIYNTGTAPGGFGSPPSGLGVLNTLKCNFFCFGAPGQQSHHALAFGSDYNAYSFTHQGAADDHIVSSISNQAYAVSLAVGSVPGEVENHYVAVDGNGNVGVDNNVVAGATVVAGQANTNPYPSPTPGGGSLISHTGAGTGELLLGDSSNYIRCDYGETTASVLTCNRFSLDAGGLMQVTAGLMAAKSATSSTGPVPPVYQQDGTSGAGGLHIVKNTNSTTVKTNGICSPNTWCSLDNNSIALSSAAEFTSTSYSCALSSSSSYRLILMVNNQSTTGFTIQAYYPSTLTIIPGGTDLGIQYECSGN